MVRKCMCMCMCMCVFIDHHKIWPLRVSMHASLQGAFSSTTTQVPSHQRSSQDSLTFLFINNCQVNFLFINYQKRTPLTYSHRQMRRRYLGRYLCMCGVGSTRIRMHA